MTSRLTRAAYKNLLAIARRHCRHGVEAEDLLQDALEAAIIARRPLSPEGYPWLRGTMRNMARMRMRGLARRRDRESGFAGVHPTHAGPPEDERLAVGALPSGLRIVALLSLSGHTRAEIRYLLRIHDDALRQRICALRGRLKGDGGGSPSGFPGLRGELAFGAIRRSLLPLARHAGMAFASHDPDGHPVAFKISSAQPHRPPRDGNRGMETGERR